MMTVPERFNLDIEIEDLQTPKLNWLRRPVLRIIFGIAAEFWKTNTLCHERCRRGPVQP